MSRALAPLCLILAAGSACAAEPALSRLSVEEAGRLALRSDPDVQSAQAELEAARAVRRQAGLLVPSNPVLAARVASDGVFADTGERSESVEITQEFWAPGQRSARIEAGDAAVTAGEASLAWARRRAIAGAAIAHVRASAARRKEADARALQQVLVDLERVASGRVEAGELSEFERNQVVLDSVAGLAEVTRLESEAASALADLKLRTGAAIDASTALEGGVQPIAWSDLERLAAVASSAERPDVVAAQGRRDQAESQLTVMKRERRPRPSIVVGWESDRSVLLGDDFTGLPFAPTNVRVDDSDDLLVIGAELTIPLAATNRAEVARALADRTIAEIDALRTRRGAEADVARLLTLGRALSGARAAIESVPAVADANLSTLQRAYEVGQLGLADVLRERDRVLRSKLAAEDVAVAFVETEVELAAAIGALNLLGLDVGNDAGSAP